MRIGLAVLASLAGGVLLLASGVSGSVGLYGVLLELLARFLSPPYDVVVYYIMMVLSFFASLGGISVLIGGLLIYKRRITTGKLLVSLGCGTGVLGYLVMLVSQAMEGSEALLAFLITATGSTGWLGISLSVLAMWLAKKPPEPKKPPEAERTGIYRAVRP